MYQRVTFYDEAGLNRRVNCYFTSSRALNNFIKILDSMDHTIMSMDLWDEEIIPRYDYSLIPGNMRGFKMVVKSLYPNLYPL